jgi:electron transport complex protein RnfG
MKNAFKMILVLVVVGLVSGGALVSVYNYASPLIEKNKEKELKEALDKVLPGAVYKEIESGRIYEGRDKRGRLIGYAFIAEGNGYQGKIKIIAGIDTGLKNLKGIEVLESSETPGLGAEIMNEAFKSQFRGLSILPEISFTKGEVSKKNEVQAITGATISTRSVVEILNKEIEYLKGVLGR